MVKANALLVIPEGQFETPAGRELDAIVLDDPVHVGAPDVLTAPPAPPVAVTEVFRAFLKLGLTSFGGPIAHLGYFRDEFVVRRQWLDEATYADLVALCQFLPGPASQPGRHRHRAGRARATVGALAAWAGVHACRRRCFSWLFAYGVDAPRRRRRRLADPRPQARRGGRGGAGRAGAWRARSRPIARAAHRTRGARAGLLADGASAQVGAIALGAVGGTAAVRNGAPRRSTHAAPRREPDGGRRRAGRCSRCSWSGCRCWPRRRARRRSRCSTPSIARARWCSAAATSCCRCSRRRWCRRAGTTSDAFLAGYGAAQAVPGPLFTFAAYLGAVSRPVPPPLLGAAVALIAIFLPGFLLLVGVLPFWTTLRAAARRAGRAAAA